MKPTQRALGCCILRVPVRTSFLVSDSTVGLFGGVESWEIHMDCSARSRWGVPSLSLPGAGRGQGPAGLPSVPRMERGDMGDVQS